MSTARALLFRCLLVFFTAGSTRAAATAPSEIYDGFEEAKLGSYWRTDKLVDGAIVLQSEIVRSGKRALKLTIHEGDRFSAADSPGNRDGESNERDELQEGNNPPTREGEAWAYSFSLYIPKDFPIVPTRLVLAQWKHKNDHGTDLVNSPVIALRYENGELSISTQTDRKKVTRFHLTEDIRGKWTDLRFHIRFSRGQDGFVQAWMNEKEVLHFNGPTAYGEPLGYPVGGTFYFKMGLYRDRMKEPMTIYLDEYRKRALPVEKK